MMENNGVDYVDSTALTEEDIANINQLVDEGNYVKASKFVSNFLKTKKYGKPTRGAMSLWAENMGNTAMKLDDTVQETKELSIDTQRRFDIQISGQNYDNEAKDARVSKAASQTFSTLKDHLDWMEQQPQEAINKLLLARSIQYLNPIDLGLVEEKDEGTYEILDEFQEYIANHTGGALEFPNGKFYFHKTINLKAPFSLKFSQNTHISIADDFVGTTLFAYKGGNINSKYTYLIGNGCSFEGNNIIDNAFTFENMSRVQGDYLRFQDFNKTFISASGKGYGLNLRNIFGENITNKPEGTDLSQTTGIYCEWSDNTFVDCTFVNVSKGIYVLGAANDEIRCHIWNVEKYVPISTGFVVAQKGWARLSYCIADTCQTGFRLNQRSYLDHCRIVGNSAYEKYMQQDPVAVEFTDINEISDISITDCLFENNYQNLVLQATKDLVKVDQSLFNKMKISNNHYIGRIGNKFPEMVDTVSDSSFTPTFYGATVAGKQKYDTAEGHYKRIGNIVFVDMVLQVQLDDALKGNYLIGGLPYENGKTNANLNVGWRSSSSGKPLITSLDGLTCNMNPYKDFCELLYNEEKSEVPRNVSDSTLGTDYIYLCISGFYFID